MLLRVGNQHFKDLGHADHGLYLSYQKQLQSNLPDKQASSAVNRKPQVSKDRFVTEGDLAPPVVTSFQGSVAVYSDQSQENAGGKLHSQNAYSSKDAFPDKRRQSLQKNRKYQTNANLVQQINGYQAG